MGYWTAALDGARCGADEGHAMRAGDPLYVITGKIYRCEIHAPEHAAVDYAAVHAAQDAMVAAHAHQAVSDTTVFKGGAPVLPGFVQAAGETVDRGMSQRLPPPRPPLPFAAVADIPDPKALAFND